jgi:uncharacterized Zn finger protein (UPF0148 family)
VNVESMERHCARCSATVYRLNGKWWCAACRRFVPLKRPKGGQ